MRLMLETVKNGAKSILGDRLLCHYRRMRSQYHAVRRSLSTKVTLDDLVADIRAAGILPGDVIGVHSSMSSLGNVQGGAKTVIDSFMEVVTEAGTVLMSSYLPAQEAFDVYERGGLIDLRTQRSHSGLITEVFRQANGVLRSSHPFSPVLAWGKRAEYFVKDHAKHHDICHWDSPLGKLLRENGKSVGLGINVSYIDMYHVLEDTWEEYPLKTTLPPKLISYIDQNGEMVTRNVSRLDPEVAKTRLETETGSWIRGFITKAYRKRGILKEFPVGNTTGWIVECRTVYEALKELARQGITIYSTREQYELLKKKYGGIT